jgi:hypothetical protein
MTETYPKPARPWWKGAVIYQIYPARHGREALRCRFNLHGLSKRLGRGVEGNHIFAARGPAFGYAVCAAESR